MPTQAGIVELHCPFKTKRLKPPFMDGAETFAAQEAFRPYLMPGESILWTGRPQQGKSLTTLEIACIIAAILLLIIIFFTRPPLIVAIAISVFAIINATVWLVLEPHVRRKTMYAISNQRIMRLRTRLIERLDFLDLHKIRRIAVEDQINGRGTLEFNPSVLSAVIYFKQLLPGMEARLRFLGIENVRAVYDLIHRTAATPAP